MQRSLFHGGRQVWIWISAFWSHPRVVFPYPIWGRFGCWLPFLTSFHLLKCLLRTCHRAFPTTGPGFCRWLPVRFFLRPIFPPLREAKYFLSVHFHFWSASFPRFGQTILAGNTVLTLMSFRDWIRGPLRRILGTSCSKFRTSDELRWSSQRWLPYPNWLC